MPENKKTLRNQKYGTDIHDNTAISDDREKIHEFFHQIYLSTTKFQKEHNNDKRKLKYFS